ncbi:hypothetical protein Egran_06187 [Elaphomyces granulatus]|uniref:Uncharacterized protein n=1 Tax=Elaphomyces granulatus TaxID=519963 RepID=A0A232LQG7_9EURO|nr:hypothetical protein Egran_06187 [Elaphomyces granulatus]
MRNLCLEKGLVKNARVRITALLRNVVRVELLQTSNLSSTSDENVFLLPRINFEFKPRRANWTVQRRQFPLQILCSLTIPACYEANSDDVKTDVFIPTQVRFYADLSLSSDLAPEALIYAWGTDLADLAYCPGVANPSVVFLGIVQERCGRLNDGTTLLHYRMRVTAYNASTRSSDSFPVAVYLKNGKRWQNFPLLSTDSSVL